MTVEVINCEQGDDNWFAARLGIPTASEFGTVLAKPRKGSDESRMRRTYMLKLLGERLTGEPMENYTNHHMERGKLLEDEARSYYAFMRDADLERIGFIRNGRTGCSPDSLIGANGVLEVKTKLPHLLLDCLLKGDFPPEHKAQCQGELWITGREYVDLIVYWPKMPAPIVRAYRDETYIKNLGAAVDAFCDELEALEARIRRHSRPSIKDQLTASLERVEASP